MIFLAAQLPQALVVLALVTCLAPAASAQAPDPITKCHSITNDAARLDCYDKLPTQQPSNAGATYRSMTLTDLKLDLRNLVGHKIEVTGRILAGTEIVQLRSAPLDTDPIFVSLKSVPREQRGAILKQCSDDCMVIVRATVIPSTYNLKPTLEADSVMVR